ncbi:MAG: DNA cytosine methyltransferase [Candidatus Enteromonas sp.]|nr:DNA cytosine methyltransferase [Candidatus Enteromonas sp.]
MRKYNIIDLFSGCGGLLDGFLQSGLYCPVASVEWEKYPVLTLRKRLKEKYGVLDAEQSVVFFDMQRTDELLHGFDDPKYGKNPGLLKLVGKKKIDFIIGGPPCQAYSVAGRVSVDQKVKPDYRNYLFEYYLKVVSTFRPKMFVFENVPGMLSAMPDGTPIIDLIRRDMANAGYEIIDDIRKFAILDASDYNVPQTRKRVILVGMNKNYFNGKNIQTLLQRFYSVFLEKQKSNKKVTVQEAIGNLPGCYPLFSNKAPSHTTPNTNITWQIPRFNSVRDVRIFQMLAEDVSSGKNELQNSEKLKQIYNEATGAHTNVHKYHVLKPNEPSTTILAHLYKDGLRFIHYDPKQARSITVREAARLQTFDDDFDFVGSQGDAFKMIGNAVPTKLALAISRAIDSFIKEVK